MLDHAHAQADEQRRDAEHLAQRAVGPTRQLVIDLGELGAARACMGLQRHRNCYCDQQGELGSFGRLGGITTLREVFDELEVHGLVLH